MRELRRDEVGDDERTLSTFPVNLTGCVAPMKSLIRAELTRGDTGSFDIVWDSQGQTNAWEIQNASLSLGQRVGVTHLYCIPWRTLFKFGQ
jgi:hypothetical protein